MNRLDDIEEQLREFGTVTRDDAEWMALRIRHLEAMDEIDAGIAKRKRLTRADLGCSIVYGAALLTLVFWMMTP